MKKGHEGPTVTVDEAVRMILSGVRRHGRTERVALDAAAGRRLAAEIKALDAYPRFDNSAMDGFALSHPGEAGARRFLVIGEARAGAGFGGRVGPGEAVRIMTGAPIPAGADTVVMKEDCEVGEGAVIVKSMPEKGANVRYAGEDVRAGDTVAAAGAVIGPVEVAAAASAGHAGVEVYCRPKVAIMATGTELCEPGESLSGGMIWNSNSHAIAALAVMAGCEPLNMGIVRDEPGAVAEAVLKAGGADAIVTTGGVSVGEYDFVREELAAAGCRTVFWGVAMRPGRPAFFGMLGERPVFGLPGNAVSAMVVFTVLAMPALLAIGGDPSPVKPRWKAALSAGMKKKKGFELFARAVLKHDGRGLVADPARGQGSHQVFGMGGANALVALPAEADYIGPGSMVDAIPFGNIAFSVDIR